MKNYFFIIVLVSDITISTLANSQTAVFQIQYFLGPFGMSALSISSVFSGPSDDARITPALR